MPNEVEEPKAMRAYVLPYSVIRRVERLAHNLGFTKREVIIKAILLFDENDPRLQGKEGWNAED
jgi:hypothetical protein